MLKNPPTIFHITHWKAGSQWIAEILKQSAPERFIPMEIADPHGMGGSGTLNFYMNPLRRGKIYGTVYLTREQFQNVVFDPIWRIKEPDGFYFRRAVLNWWNYGIRQSPYRAFIVIRDLRDTLISLYFSAKYSHKVVSDQLSEIKRQLESLNEEDGLMYMLDVVLQSCAEIQISWLESQDLLLLRYEDILGNEYTFFENLIEHCQINVNRERLHGIIRYNIFEAATGRKPGQEDIYSHLRKGVAGDWKNYFTIGIKEKFKTRYGELLIKTGYEKDLSW